MTEILQIYKEFYAPRRDYCVLCFRAGEERRLGGTQWLQELAAGLGGRDDFSEDFQKLCFVCESRVRGALRVHEALSTARAIHTALRVMAARRGFDGEDALAELGGVSLAGARAAAELVCTEVLSVSCGPSQQPPMPPQPPLDLFVLPDTPPFPPALTPRPHTRLANHDLPQPETAPKMLTLDGTDPTFLKIVGLSPASSLPGAPQLPPLRLCTGPLPVQDSAAVTSVLLDRLLADYSLNPGLDDGPDLTSTKIVSDGDLMDDPGGGDVQIIMDDEPEAKEPRVDEERKRPAEKRDERPTDWEDKIPMDVISFVTASDSNVAPVRGPQAGSPKPIAVISAVRSTRGTTEADGARIDDVDAPSKDNYQTTFFKILNRNSEVNGDGTVNVQTQTDVDGGKSSGTRPIISNTVPVYRNVKPVLGGWRGRRGRRHGPLDRAPGARKSPGAPSDVIDLC